MRKVLPFTFFFSYAFCLAAHIPPEQKINLSQKLSAIQNQILLIEKNLIATVRDEGSAANRIKNLRALLVLRQKERQLGEQRLKELESFITELISRRESLQKKIKEQQTAIRIGLTEVAKSFQQKPLILPLPQNEKILAPRRKLISKLIDRRLKEIEILKMDLSDADHLETRIQEERQHLAYLFQDLKEQEDLLVFHRSLQEDILRKKHLERLKQLENYRNLKKAEAEVEKLIKEFNARLELKQVEETQKAVTKAIYFGDFAQLKGKLLFPVQGKIVSNFGRSLDVKSNLYVFKKGIEIATMQSEPVRSVAGGKIVYSGILGDYGKVVIVDHGAHYYSLFAHLGQFSRKLGELVAPGDELGRTQGKAHPLYFEVRARNVAVNPLQWLSN